MNFLKTLLKKVHNSYRRLKLWAYNNTIGKHVEICKMAYLTHCYIGDYCYLGMYSYFNHVRMGNYCSISGFVTIGAMEHDYTDISTSTHLGDGGYSDHITVIGNDVWIGAQTVVRQGVSIGDGAVIGANSFVNKDIPPYAIAFGTPAKVYKYRFNEQSINRIRASEFWHLSTEEAMKRIIKLRSEIKANPEEV